MASNLRDSFFDLSATQIMKDVNMGDEKTDIEKAFESIEVNTKLQELDTSKAFNR